MYAAVNGVRIFFDVDGYGLIARGGRLVEKPVVAVLHGGPGLDHSDLPPWLRPLSSTAQLLYLDHRGNGRSQRLSPDECTPELMADDLEALRLTLGIPRLIPLGFSFGGTVATCYAHRYPDSVTRMILCSTPTHASFLDQARQIVAERGSDEQIAAVEHLFKGAFTDEAHLRTALESLRPLYYHRYRPDYDHSRQWTITNTAMINWYFGTYARQLNLHPLLPQIHATTLVLVGKHDWICPPQQAEALVQLLPNARQILFEESGHIPLKEEHEGFLAIVNSFVAEAEPAASQPVSNVSLPVRQQEKGAHNA